MPFYQNIDPKVDWGKRTLERLIELRKALTTIPERTQKETLLLATWNIREFDSPKYGKRLDEALYYIAEIIDRFDLVAVQEVRKDLEAVDRLMKILGGNWDYIFTDTTEGTAGNNERMAFLFDKRKITFGGLAGELVLPPIKKDGKDVPVTQLARTPFICGFKSGWTKFMLVTVHIIWGTKKDEPEPPERVEEIRQVAQFLKARTEDDVEWARNIILLGDFNIYKPENATFKEIEKAGFVIPEQIRKNPSNALKTRHYDQIAFKVRENSLDLTGNAGAFDYYQTVFKTDDEQSYKPFMLPDYDGKPDKPRSEKEKTNYYLDWRTFQMSDHLPLWVELKIDYSDEYLKYKLEHP